MHLPIEQALTLEYVRVYCDGEVLRVVACGYSWPYDLTVDNLVRIHDAGMVCKRIPTPPGANARARALVDW